MSALVALSAVAATHGLAFPLRVCTVSTCKRNGGDAFFEAVAALSADTELQVASSGCMSRCRGIVVSGGPLKGTASLDPLLSKDDAISALESASAFLDEAGVDTKAIAAALVAKAQGDEAMQAGDHAAAIARYSEAIESPLAADLKADEEEQDPPVFRLKGRPALQEEERITPRRVRWLFESLLGRCRSRLEAAAGDEAALCPLAGGGWYRMRDAAQAGGNRAIATKAEDELTRLGYALDLEGPLPTEAERRAFEQQARMRAAEEERQRAAAQHRAEQRARELAAAAEKAAREEKDAAEAARVLAEWNTPEAVAARAQAAADDALRAKLAAARRQPAGEELLDKYKWSGKGRRKEMLSGVVARLSSLSAEAQAAAAAGAGGEALAEANEALEEMEATRQAMEAM